MTKFLTEKKRTLGSAIQMNTVSKVTELNAAELDQVQGGVNKGAYSLDDKKTFFDLGADDGFTDTTGSTALALKHSGLVVDTGIHI
jgi:hypothetical protein